MRLVLLGFVNCLILFHCDRVSAEFHRSNFQYQQQEFYYPEFAPTNPVSNGTVQVGVQVEISNYAFNEFDYTMDVSLTLILKWKDGRLAWRDASRDSVEEFSQYILWRPPYSMAYSHNLANAGGNPAKEHKLTELAEVTADGSVTLVTSYRLSRVPCYYLDATSIISNASVICFLYLDSLNPAVRFQCVSSDKEDCVHSARSQDATHGLGFNLWKLNQWIPLHYVAEETDNEPFSPLYNLYTLAFLLSPTSAVNYYIFFMPSIMVAICVALLFLTNPMSELRALITVIMVAAVFAILSEIYGEKSTQMGEADEILHWYMVLLAVIVIGFLWSIIGRQLWMYEMPKFMDNIVEYVVLVFDKVAFLFLLPPDLTEVIKKACLEAGNGKELDSDISDSVRKSMVDWLKCVLVIDRVLLYICVAVLVISYTRVISD